MNTGGGRWMSDRELLAIADGMNERLWHVAMDCHDPAGGVYMAVTRPMRRMLPDDYGVWFTQILVREIPNVCIGACAVTVGVQEDGTVRAYHPDDGGQILVTRGVLSVLVRFDEATDGMLSRAMAREDPASRATAERIVSAQRARSKAV